MPPPRPPAASGPPTPPLTLASRRLDEPALQARVNTKPSPRVDHRQSVGRILQSVPHGEGMAWIIFRAPHEGGWARSAATHTEQHHRRQNPTVHRGAVPCLVIGWRSWRTGSGRNLSRHAELRRLRAEALRRAHTTWRCRVGPWRWLDQRKRRAGRARVRRQGSCR